MYGSLPILWMRKLSLEHSVTVAGTQGGSTGLSSAAAVPSLLFTTGEWGCLLGLRGRSRPAGASRRWAGGQVLVRGPAQGQTRGFQEQRGSRGAGRKGPPPQGT